MNRRIYNFATIEYHKYLGPGKVIGVLAVDSEAAAIPYIFIDKPDLKHRFEEVVDHLDNLLTSGRNAELNGKDLMRVITTPRQALVRFVPRGVRYCELNQENEMLQEILARFTGEKVSLAKAL